MVAVELPSLKSVMSWMIPSARADQTCGEFRSDVAGGVP